MSNKNKPEYESEEYTDTENEEYTENTGTEEPTVTESEDENSDKKTTTKKSNGNKILYMIVAVLVAVGAYKGYQIWFGGNNAPTNQQQNTTPVAPPKQQPPSEQQLQAPTPAQNATPEVPVQQPQVQPPVSQNGPEALPNVGQEVQSPAVEQPPVEQPPVQQPVVQAPVVQSPVDQSPVITADPNSPVVSQNQAPIQTGSNAVNEDQKAAIDRLIDKVDSMDDSFKNVNDTVNTVKDTVTDHTGKIASLDARVTKLEENLKSQQEAATVAVAKAAEKTTVKPIVKKKTVSKVSHSTRNSVQLLSDEDRVVSKKRVKASHANTSANGSSNASKGSYGYSIQAVLPGRAWIKNPNGTTSTYSVGDMLPNGNKVGKIDPDGGIVDSVGRSWPK